MKTPDSDIKTAEFETIAKVSISCDGGRISHDTQSKSRDGGRISRDTRSKSRGGDRISRDGGGEEFDIKTPNKFLPLITKKICPISGRSFQSEVMC